MRSLPQGQGDRWRSSRLAAKSDPSSRRSALARAVPNLLESIVAPHKQIAQGFESVVLATSDGKVHTGVFRGEDDKEVRLMTALGKPLAVSKDTIEEPQAQPLGNAWRSDREAVRGPSCVT